MDQKYIDICIAGNYFSSIGQFKDLIKKLFSGNWTKDTFQDIQELVQLTRAGRVKDWIESFESIDENIGSLLRRTECAEDLSDDEILCELADSCGIKDKFYKAKASLISLAASNTEKRNGFAEFTFEFNVFNKCTLSINFSFVVKRKGYDDEVSIQTHNLLRDNFKAAFIVPEFTQADYFLFIEGVDSPVWKNAEENIEEQSDLVQSGQDIKENKASEKSEIHVISYANGDHKYVGYMRNGEFHGYGRFHWPDGTAYYGYWQNGKRVKGRFFFKGGGFFNGDWINDEPKEGVGHYASGSEYTGCFKDWKRHGKGKMVWIDGTRYEGDWVDDKRTGKGVQIWSDGGRYEGDWVDGKPTGKGNRTWPNGDRYEGDWVDDKMTGKGVYIWPDGDRYEGDWVDCKPTGKGVYIWSDGGRYEGDWVDGKRTGKGKRTWPNGGRYEGDWVDDKMTGYGTYFNSDGTIEKTGRWDKDRYVG